MCKHLYISTYNIKNGVLLIDYKKKKLVFLELIDLTFNLLHVNQTNVVHIILSERLHLPKILT